MNGTAIILLLTLQFQYPGNFYEVSHKKKKKLNSKLPSGLQKSNGNMTKRMSLWLFRLALPYWSYLSNVTTNMHIIMLGSLKSNEKIQLVY